MNRRLAFLGLAVLGLLLAWALQRFMDEQHLEFYSFFSINAQGVAQERAGEAEMNLGPCDLFMYRNAEALGGFLSFVLVYLSFTLVGRLLVGRPSHPSHSLRLLAWSLFFLLVVLGPQALVRLVELVLLIFLLDRLPWGPRWRGAAILGGTAGFFAWAGADLMEILLDQRFLAPGFAGLPDGWLSFPCLFLGLAMLVKLFRRVLWLALETSNGTLARMDALELSLYLVGFPFLLANAVTPSPSQFRASRGNGPDEDAGARTLAWCLGVTPLLLTATAMAAYSPAVRLFFPACDVPHASQAQVWGRILVTFPVDFLYLLVTEQGSVGVARLFGYGLKDNFDRPLLAANPAEFWRRWDIYWREFLLAAFYFPTALHLARRDGGPRRWHLVPAVGLTFFGTWALNLLPLALLRADGWLDIVPSLAVYYFLDGLAVGLTALALWGRTGRSALVSSGTTRRLGLAVVATFVFMALVRTFMNAQFTIDEQWMIVLKALGIELPG